MPTYDLPLTFDFDDPRVQKTITAITAKNIRVTAAHVSQSRTLHFIAEWYAARYDGRFDFMRQMRDLINAGRDLSVNQMAGIVNCLVHDASKRKPTRNADLDARVTSLMESWYAENPKPREPNFALDSGETPAVKARYSAWCDRENQARIGFVNQVYGVQSSKVDELPADLPAVALPGTSSPQYPLNDLEVSCSWCGTWCLPQQAIYTDDGYVCVDRKACRNRQRTQTSIAGMVAKPIASDPESGKSSTLYVRDQAVTPMIANGTYTVVLNESGDYRTLRVESARNKPEGTQVVGFLSGPNNERDFTDFAWLSGQTIGVWPRYRGDSLSMTALEKLVYAGDDKRADYGMAYALESGRCYRCGRTLTVSASIHRGLGPDCAKRS